jgi:hypothetical protein
MHHNNYPEILLLWIFWVKVRFSSIHKLIQSPQAARSDCYTSNNALQTVYKPLCAWPKRAYARIAFSVNFLHFYTQSETCSYTNTLSRYPQWSSRHCLHTFLNFQALSTLYFTSLPLKLDHFVFAGLMSKGSHFHHSSSSSVLRKDAPARVMSGERNGKGNQFMK